MIMRLKYIIFTILVVAFSGQLAFSQVKVTDKAGDKIILMPDGTWRYADEGKQATASNDVKAKQQSGNANLDKKKLTSAEKKKLAEQEKAEKRRQKIAEKVAKQQKGGQKDTASKNSSKKDKKDKSTAKKDKNKKDNKSKSTAKKNNSKKDNKSKSTAKKNNSKKNNKSKNTAKSNTKKNNSNKNKVASNKTKSTQKKANNKAVQPKKISDKQRVKLAKQQFKPFKKQDNIVIKEQECSYEMNEIDPFTGKKKVALHSEFFFGYTHPQLEKYLKGDHYMVCDAYMSQVSGLKALNVKFTIDSPNAQEDYGAILEGSRMLVSLLDGTTITLVSAESDDGKVDKVKKQTIYRAYFVIDPKSEKQILKSEINQVRMVWSEGYEDYEIHEVDFLINQLNCLKAATK